MCRKIIWAIVIVALIIIICGGEKKVKNDDLKSTSCSGASIKAISIVFADYSKGREGFKKDIEYYDFKYCLENKNQINIEISLNTDVVPKRTNTQLVVGGGAEYIIDLNSWEIVNKKLYK
jgi:hypothetical protein